MQAALPGTSWHSAFIHDKSSQEHDDEHQDNKGDIARFGKGEVTVLTGDKWRHKKILLCVQEGRMKQKKDTAMAVYFRLPFAGIIRIRY